MTTRNLPPLFCGRENRLHIAPGDPAWRVWAEDEPGRAALKASLS